MKLDLFSPKGDNSFANGKGHLDILPTPYFFIEGMFINYSIPSIFVGNRWIKKIFAGKTFEEINPFLIFTKDVHLLFRKIRFEQ